MHKSILLTLILFAFGTFSVNAQIAPKAAKKPVTTNPHGVEMVDNYSWLNERDADEVNAYLKSENRYTEAELRQYRGLRKQIYAEIRNRINDEDLSVPYLENGYWYYTKYERGKDLGIYCRKEGSLEAEEEVILDPNTLAEDYDYYEVYGFDISPDNNIMVYYPDTSGNFETPAIFKNLVTGETYREQIPAVVSLAWASDNQTVFYTQQDAVTNRSNKVFKHTMGSHFSEDQMIYEETDELFDVYVWRTKSGEFIVQGSYSANSSESWFLPADKPDGAFTVIEKRQENHEYDVYHYGDFFYILSDLDAPNRKLMKVRTTQPDAGNWFEIIGMKENARLETVEIFDKYLVLQYKKEGLNEIRIMEWETEKNFALSFDQEVYSAFLGYNPAFNTTKIRYNYQSMTTPNSVIEYDMSTGEKTVLKQNEVPGGHNPEDYISLRAWAPSRDGKKIPISIVYRKGTKIDGTAPLFLSGYGSYGASSHATFSRSRLSLLDRGFVVAVAHVRGGQEMGREWYLDGKMMNKKNTFNDFIDCAEYLIEQKYTSKGEITAYGASAGGLLMGAIVNDRPDLWKTVILDVPFVDVINTMSDPSIPLTTQEYEEWGNPEIEEEFNYMLSYSPYDNVEAKDYPNMFFLTAINDEQVGYWEAAKMTAKLREMKTDNNTLLFNCNMTSGHGGDSGRFGWIADWAMMYTFVLTRYGIEK